MTQQENIQHRATEACELLKRMIEIPSCTFEEELVADFLFAYLEQKAEELKAAEGVGREKGRSSFKVLRIANNIIAIPDSYNPQLQTLMLNAHIDTVKPAESYTNNPYQAIERDGKIYGLGSNDDGGSVVALVETFLHFATNETLNSVNIILVLCAEEERSGAGGVTKVLEQLPQHGIKVDFAIVGEPTGMRAAVAERGLLVLDGTAYGVSGHAARGEGENALYKAMDAIHALRKFKFAKHSQLMGSVKLTVTQINAGTVHNVIPDRCTFVVDIRPTEQYTNPEILALLQNEVGDSCTLVARNLKNRSSATPQDHLLMKAVVECGIETFVSPTTSDWMRLSYTASAKACINTHAGTQKSGFESIRTMEIEDIPAIKIGPGDSTRSHKADEYILKEEIERGIKTYIQLIANIAIKTDKI